MHIEKNNIQYCEALEMGKKEKETTNQTLAYMGPGCTYVRYAIEGLPRIKGKIGIKVIKQRRNLLTQKYLEAIEKNPAESNQIYKQSRTCIKSWRTHAQYSTKSKTHTH